MDPNDVTCLCDQCTLGGVRPQGSVISKSGRQAHKSAEKARRCFENLEESVLRATLRKADDCYEEDPLWRGRTSTSSTPKLISLSPQQHTDLRQFTEGKMGSSEYNEITLQISSAKTSFMTPVRLDFLWPPSSPTDMYPRGLSDDWTVGPNALRSGSTRNAPLLLYVNLLVAAAKRVQIGEVQGDKAHKLERSVFVELDRLESIRQVAWEKQQQLKLNDEGRLQDSGYFYNTGTYFLYLSTAPAEFLKCLRTNRAIRSSNRSGTTFDDNWCVSRHCSQFVPRIGSFWLPPCSSHFESFCGAMSYRGLEFTSHTRSKKNLGSFSSGYTDRQEFFCIGTGYHAICVLP